MIDVLKKISDMRDARGWSEYRLSEEAGMSQSTISTWYRKQSMPSVVSLEKICQAYDITLSQFFSEGEEAVPLTADQRDLLNRWSSLDKKQKEALLTLMEQKQS